MTVYVLTHHRDTPEEAVSEVVGVYSHNHLESAREKMKRISRDMLEELASVGIDSWDPDMCWDDSDDICFGKMGDGYESDTVYQWAISKMEVI